MRHLFASLALAAVVVPGAMYAQDVASFATTPVPALAVQAQAPAAAAPATSERSATPSAMVRQDVAGISTHSKSPLEVSSAAAEGLHQGEGVALMAVGGAGLVAGLLIGGNAGTAVAIGGLAVGLVGLYEYVR